MLALPRSDDVLQDHRAVRLVRGVPRLPEGKTDKKGERHGDSFIALALAWRATEADHPPAAGETVDSDRSAYMPRGLQGRPSVSLWGRPGAEAVR